MFRPFEELAQHCSFYIATDEDGAHDLSHIVRVWQNARLIQAVEGGDLRLVAAATLLHDCVHIPKNSPERARAADLAADKAFILLSELGWSGPDLEVVIGAIRTHSYSNHRNPTTIEGRILQDADRLDAIGAIGIARCFYTAGHMRSKLYHLSDPEGKERDLDDASYALDHFPRKLFKLTANFTTQEGSNLAEKRGVNLREFYNHFLEEVDGVQ